jgi:hypothetical protein
MITLEIYFAVGNVEELSAGIYKYLPFRHELVWVSEGDVRKAFGKEDEEPLCLMPVGRKND